MKYVLSITFIFSLLSLHTVILASEETKTWGATAGYMITSDYADERSPRLYENKVLLNLSGNFLPYQITTTMKNSINFNTLGNSVYEENPDSHGIHFADTILVFNKTLALSQTNSQFPGIHQLTPIVFNIFPTSDSSRYAGYRSSPGAQAVLSSTFFDGHYNLKNGINFIKVINTYTHNPANHTPSPSLISVFEQDHTIALGLGFSIGAGFSFKYSKDVDGNSNTTFENSASLEFAYKQMSASLVYSGGDHTTIDKVELWYVDNTRELLTLVLTYTI